MPALTPTEVEVQRSAPAEVEYFLAVMPRWTVFQCRLNDDEATWNLTSLAWDGAMLGAWGDVVIGQTLLAYDSTMATYKGKVRIKAITAGIITVAANSNIEWADDDVLRVVYVFEPWSKATHMEDDGADGTIYYKDTDIAWTSNEQAYPPNANDLGAWAGWLNSSGQADIQFDAGDSFTTAPAATISTYNRPAGDGAYIAGNAATAAGTIRFSSTGFRWITQTVTDSNGQTGVHRMPVWTFGGGYEPLTDFIIKRRVGMGRDWEVEIEAWGDDVSEDTIWPGAQVVLFTRTYIDGTERTDDFGCPFAGRGHIKMVGWILSDTVTWNFETGRVSFTIGTIGKVADDMPGYATFVDDEDAATDWHTAVAPTVKTAIFFLLHWHTTILDLYYFECAPEEIIAGRKFNKAPPFKQIENAFLMSKGLFARLGCTKWGSIHIRYDPQELEAADRAAVATVFNLTSEDWFTELALEKSHRPRASSVWGGGIFYDGTDGTPFRARAPGTANLESGREERADNLIIQSQADLNAKVGARLAAVSNLWGEVPVELTYDIWEPALQEYVTLTVSASENPRGYAFTTATKWIVRRVEVEGEPGGTPRVTLYIEQLTTPYTATALAIPEGPPVPPPPEPPPPITPPEITPGTGDWVVIGTFGAGVCYTANAISSPPPVWYQLNGGLGDSTEIWAMAMDPTRSDRLACIDGNGDVYCHDNYRAGGNWRLSITAAEAEAYITAQRSPPHSVSNGEFTRFATGVMNDGRPWLCAAIQADVGLGEENALAFSYDWGHSWSLRMTPLQPYDGWEDAYCSWCGTGCNYVTYNWGLGALHKTTPQMGNIADWGNEYMVYGGRAGMSILGNARVGLLNVSTQLVWRPCYVPSYADPSCDGSCAGGTVLGGIGGSEGGVDFRWTGPTSMAKSRNFDSVFYMTHWTPNSDRDPAKPLILARLDSPAVGENDAYEHDEAMAKYPTAFCPSPLGSSSVDWLATRVVDIGPTYETYIHRGNVSNAASAGVMIPSPCHTIQAFPTLVDNKAIVYLGRSYLTGQKATVADPSLFRVSVRYPATIASNFADHSGNLYALGAEGIVNILPDPVR